ncbi:hypothetical protein ACKXF4_08330 [Faecalibacterium prausnitzii]|uniref:hypothetical protein n=1 Tax=Faecalibacterium prausnitzii TaxID=853 RepID=UPI003AAB59C3
MPGTATIRPAIHHQLERNHVKLVSATEPISDSPAGIMVKSMLTGMAEYDPAELSAKLRAA